MSSLRKMTVVLGWLRNSSRAISTLQFLRTSSHRWLVLPGIWSRKSWCSPVVIAAVTHLPETSEVSLSSSCRCNTRRMMSVDQVLGTQALNSHLWARHGNLLWHVAEIQWQRHWELWKDEMRTRRERRRKDGGGKQQSSAIYSGCGTLQDTHVYAR